MVNAHIAPHEFEDGEPNAANQAKNAMPHFKYSGGNLLYKFLSRLADATAALDVLISWQVTTSQIRDKEILRLSI